MKGQFRKWAFRGAMTWAAVLAGPIAESLGTNEPVGPPSTESKPKTPEEVEADKGGKKELPEGIWPSKRLLRSLLARRAEDVSREYGFDDEQKAKTREAIVEGWSQFLGERREQLQPLLNEFLELRLDEEPPSKERVQAWAEKAGPAFDELRDRAGKSVDELRQIVKPGQRIAFEAEALKLQAGLALAGTKLQDWRSGQFDAKDFWEPLPNERRREREKAQAESGSPSPEGSALPASEKSAPDSPLVEDQIAAELTAWEKYVTEFSKRYELNPAQRDAVRSCLAELSERAKVHRDRHREEIAQLEIRIAASPGKGPAVEEISRDVVVLYGPIDEMFTELKNRVEAIPTSEQRESAKKRESQTPAPAAKP